jgi:hypothetical protein
MAAQAGWSAERHLAEAGIPGPILLSSIIGGGREPVRERRSLLGLDEEHSLLEKLGLFLTALFLGPLLGLLLFAGVNPLKQPWRSLAGCFCEALAVFWVCLLVFIGWRPPWFRMLYLAAERKVVLIVRFVCLASLLFVAVVVLVRWLREMRGL